MTMKKTFISMAFLGVLFADRPILAQDVPPLNPPDAAWPTPPVGGIPPPPMPGTDGVPPPGAIPPPTGTFEPFDFGGEEDGGGFGGSGSGGNGREGKNSFQMVSPTAPRPDCDRYGNDVLGARTFEDYGSCNNELEKRMDRLRGDIDEVFDRFERQKLKTVIRGNLSRKEAADYKLEFPKLRQQTLQAAKKGCVCRK